MVFSVILLIYSGALGGKRGGGQQVPESEGAASVVSPGTRTRRQQIETPV